MKRKNNWWKEGVVYHDFNDTEALIALLIIPLADAI